jgi:hypothetical protein
LYTFASKKYTYNIQDQPSYSTTTNTADTSNATRLDPTVDAEARQASEEWSESAQLNAGIGLGKDAGRGPTWNTPGGVGDATNQEGLPRGENNPKGKNLTEGGFDDGAPNASFNTAIGTKKDPGRVALERFEEENVPFAGGAGPREPEVTRDNPYDELKQNTEA